MQIIFHRIQSALLTFPNRDDWIYGVKLLLLFALIDLPIGFWLKFLSIDLQLAWQTIVGVMIGALFMPALIEEFSFRAFLIPHPTESISRPKRRLSIAISWIAFLLYHLHPFVPPFFRSPAFLVGVILISTICTLAYLRSGSIWLPVVLHWVIVVVWLLMFGGLGKFQA